MESIHESKIIGAMRVLQAHDDKCDDWIEIKKRLIVMLTPDARAMFSRREPTSKKQRLNDFDRHVMSLWELMTGTKPVFKLRFSDAP